MLFATATISSCGETESTDEKTELKEGEDAAKCCSKDKECSKECKEACKKFCKEDCKDGEHSDECKAACKEHCAAEMKKHKCGHGDEEGAEHKCSDMKCEEGKCAHGEEEGAATEEGEVDIDMDMDVEVEDDEELGFEVEDDEEEVEETKGRLPVGAGLEELEPREARERCVPLGEQLEHV